MLINRLLIYLGLSYTLEIIHKYLDELAMTVKETSGKGKDQLDSKAFDIWKHLIRFLRIWRQKIIGLILYYVDTIFYETVIGDNTETIDYEFSDIQNLN